MMRRLGLVGIACMIATAAGAADQQSPVFPPSSACLVPIVILFGAPEARFPGSLVLNADGTWSATSLETVREIERSFANHNPRSLEVVLARKALADVASGHPLNPHPDCNTSLDASP